VTRTPLLPPVQHIPLTEMRIRTRIARWFTLLPVCPDTHRAGDWCGHGCRRDRWHAGPHYCFLCDVSWQRTR
jgi:hypothetical protein